MSKRMIISKTRKFQKSNCKSKIKNNRIKTLGKIKSPWNTNKAIVEKQAIIKAKRIIKVKKMVKTQIKCLENVINQIKNHNKMNLRNKMILRVIKIL